MRASMQRKHAEDISQLKQQNTELRDRAQSMKEELESSSRQAVRAVSQFNELKQQFDAANLQNEAERSSKEEVRSLKSLQAALQKDHEDRAHAANAAYRHHVLELEQQLQSERAAHAEKVAALESRSRNDREMNTHMDKQSQQIYQHQEKTIDLTAAHQLDVDNLQETITRLRKELGTSKSELMTLKMRRDRTSGDVHRSDELLSKNKALEEQVATLKHDQRTTPSQKSQLQSINEYEDLIDVLERKMGEYRESASAKDQEIERQSECIIEMASAKEQEVHALQRESAELQQQLDATMSQYKEMENTRNSQISKLTRRLSASNTARTSIQEPRRSLSKQERVSFLRTRRKSLKTTFVKLSKFVEELCTLLHFKEETVCRDCWKNAS